MTESTRSNRRVARASALIAYSRRMTQLSRTFALAGASNFRDLGGYAGLDGRSVRWRALYRSDHLAGLTQEDARVLAGLGLARVVDFRGVGESTGPSAALPALRYQALPIEPTVVQRAKELALTGQAMTAPIAAGLMRETYRAFVSDNQAQFAGLFAQLLDEGAPLVFHCTAGKDRTGFAAALILLALGVSRETVVQDYLLTNALYRRPAQVEGSAPAPVLDVIWSVQTDFLDAALQTVERDFGDLPRYLRRLGLDEVALARLRQRYLA